MTDFDNHLTERRRLVALRLLRSADMYTLDEVLLQRQLAASGHAVSRDRLRTDLAWLEEQDCIVTQKPGGVWVASLTLRGEEAAGGLARVPGIAHPRPGE